MFSLVVTQETLEHLIEPEVALAEMYRVIKPGGILFCQAPFLIGYHDGPNDFWRFTRNGLIAFVERCGFTVEESHISTGPGFGFYGVAVEFCAILISSLIHRLYRPAKGAAAVLLYPLKWLDSLLSQNPNADRIARGYIVIASKPTAHVR